MQPEKLTCKNCGTTDDYKLSKSGPHVRADCNSCGCFIKFLPQTFGLDIKLHFGKYAGTRVGNITDEGYLQWALDKLPALNKKTKNAISAQLKNLQSQAT